MIPLRIPAEIQTHRSGHTVLKLVRQLEAEKRRNVFITPERCAELIAEFDSYCVFRWKDHYIKISGSTANDIIGDVCLFSFDKGYADRLIRRGSEHNTFIATEQCDQLCIMCSQPPKKTHYDQFSEFYEACLLADSGEVIGISGGEPSLYKDELFTLLGSVKEHRPDLQFHVLTNAQHFSEGDLACSTSLQTNVLWAIPLYASTPSIHDMIVAKEGAYDRLLSSLALFIQAGALVELRTVVMQQNVTELIALARKIRTHLPFIQHWAIMQLENIGYAKNRWNEIFFDHSKDFSQVSEAAALAITGGIDVRFFNFPLCTVPLEWRPHAEKTISDWKQKYNASCLKCSVQEQCGGFFEWHPDQHSYEIWGAL